MSIVHQPYDAPIARLVLAGRGDTLVGVDLHGDVEALQQSLRRRFPGEAAGPGRLSPALRGAFDRYFGGELDALEAVAVDTGGPEFHRRVWGALRGIPVGATTTYGALARQLGKPTASRAVGTANGANPVAIVVPCHRVIGANGALTGYAGGLEMKRWLLEHEAARAQPSLRL
jgi:O-6-methylguanine DNA methyltransferase